MKDKHALWRCCAYHSPSSFFLSPREFYTESLPYLNAFTILNEPPLKITNKMTCKPSLIRVCPVWLESSMSAWRNVGALATHWVHSEDSNQMRRSKTQPTKWPVRPAKTQILSLIRVFAVCMKKHWVVSYLLRAQRRLIRLDGCPGWSASSLGAPAVFLVLSCCGSNENGEDCLYPDQTPPSPVFTLFADVPFHRTSKRHSTSTFSLL